MTIEMKKESTKIENLLSTLLTTLDEQVFFSELSKFFKSEIVCDEIIVNLAHEDGSCRMVAKDARAVKNAQRISKGLGAVGHVIKTKRAYFSNNVQRDPLFASTKTEVSHSELCVPMIIDGVIIGTISFKGNSEEVNFKKEDINMVIDSLNSIQKPLKNMKMYLSAKFLNESLKQKIEEKEIELKNSVPGVTLSRSTTQEKEIIGKSEIMQELLVAVDRVAASDVNSYMAGETGVGKEMIARRIHCRSERKNHAFIVVDCSMGNDEYLESEIFGKEEVDAVRGFRIKKGALEAANGGTIFINNIDKMPVKVQARLMSFINDLAYSRVGTHEKLRSNVRIIAASSLNMKESVALGTFREDLFYNLSTIGLRIPSLRERKSDIEILANHFLNLGKLPEAQKSMSPGVVKLLEDYNWPGNVRELHSIMERAYVLSPGMIVERDHLADSIKVEQAEINEEKEEIRIFREMTLGEIEREHICQTLDHLGGNKTKTAKVLGITVKTLYNKLHSYGMIEAKEA
ncbi:sigma-54-dependent Fis family transcriptional regulator [Halobacteriovorax sp. XZX-3]|uniref:sigma-54-dependent Fis family transcriptional regulator n=1 Tax=unclassified Halobacteriovorax TaxID=2639665 RepID=UPI000CD0E552|nr:sigma-54-dependent Fis family transcriptional regulator [Halobacteriovorax sp. DA5]POB14887.1 hypothetical protein C0Z22_00505 [Halobacteriovorax sp. DA5]